MILNLYRLVICVIMAIHGSAWINYIFNDTPISASTAAWACALTVLFLIERFYITMRIEHEMMQK